MTLKLSKLPKRTPIRITATFPPEIHEALTENARIYEQDYDVKEKIEDLVYPAHVRTRKSFGDMTRKLSDTSSHKSPQFLGTSSFRNPSMASQNSLKVA